MIIIKNGNIIKGKVWLSLDCRALLSDSLCVNNYYES
jgi:hypothetical protein